MVRRRVWISDQWEYISLCDEIFRGDLWAPQAALFAPKYCVQNAGD